MTEPVARIQSIVFGEGYAHAYAFADGKFYPLPVGGEVSGGQNIPVPAVVYRAHGAKGVFSVGKVNLPLHVHDVVRTAPGCLLTIEFLIGGRVSVNGATAVEIVNERSVADFQTGAKRSIKKHLSLWMKADAKTLKQPLEIQTNGGVLGIRG